MNKEGSGGKIIRLETDKININTLPEEIREEVRHLISLHNTYTRELSHFPLPERRKELEERLGTLDFQLRQLILS